MDIYARALQEATLDGNSYRVSVKAIPQALIDDTALQDRKDNLAREAREFSARLAEDYRKSGRQTFTPVLPKPVQLPKEFDQRDAGIISTPKNQGNFGNCWYFALAGICEAAIAKGSGKMYDLSEQLLVNCVQVQGSVGDDKISPWDLVVNRGFVLESELPYVGNVETCKNLPCIEKNDYLFRFVFPLDKETQALLESWGAVIEGNGVVWYTNKGEYGMVNTTGEDFIKRVIFNYGGCCVYLICDEAIMSYEGGIFNHVPDDSVHTDHAVMLIGWNDREGYWIIKNSWGTDWGEEGYMRLKYGSAKMELNGDGTIYRRSQFDYNY